MFVRVKHSGPRQYLQLVENRWINGQSRQRVIGTLGRLDELQPSGKLDTAIESLARFATRLKVVRDHQAGRLAVESVKRIGPDLVLSRIWAQLGIRDVLNQLLERRHFGFDVERAIYFTVLSRLFFPGSDHRSLRLAREYQVAGDAEIELHQLYRAMAWLGAVKEQVEERLFARNRDLFSGLDLVFFDTTSLYFEGEGGESLGRCGYSKDGCPDKHQMIVGAVLDRSGRPLSCPMWPGNTTDARTILPVATRLRDRFGVKDLVVVADRGMIGKANMAGLEKAEIGYILGVRMRRVLEVKSEVLDAPGAYQDVADNLKVKEVNVSGKRYIVCFNPERAAQERIERAAALEALSKGERPHFHRRVVRYGKEHRPGRKISEAEAKELEKKIRAAARFDGKYVLQTNTGLSPDQVAVRYKELWQVERIFREVKSILETRPVYHRRDRTIEGHVFCSFLGLMVMKELMKAVEGDTNWDEIRQDLDALYETEVIQDGTHHLLRGPYQGNTRAILRSIGIAPPPAVAIAKT